MALDEIIITQAIIDRFTEKLKACLEVDVAIVGAGPAGLTASYYLSCAGFKVALFERKLSVGGGMWGGGMMFNEIVVQEDAKDVLDALDVAYRPYREGYYTADAIEAVTTIASKSMKAGTRIFNLIEVEDVLLQNNTVQGLVINWSAVSIAGLHVDPLTMRAKFVIDATGHPAEVMHLIERKVNIKLNTATGKVMGERSMWAEIAEEDTLKNTREAFPGVYVTGMTANATYGSYRMGPVFGGMIRSGRSVARQIQQRLAGNDQA